MAEVDMDPLSDVLKRLLVAHPEVPEALRDEIVGAGREGADGLLDLFRRLADEALRIAEEHQRRLADLIGRT